MRIIETCPKCGADIVDVCIATNPAIPAKWCPSCGWSWTGTRDDVVRVPFTPPGVPSILNDKRNNADGIPECCKLCSNHPSNGGSGICNCTAPYFSDGGWKITCTSTEASFKQFMFGTEGSNGEA